MTSIQASGSASFSLFPNSNSSTPRPSLSIPTRRSESRERRALSPQQNGRRPSTSHAASPRLDDGPLVSRPHPPISSNSPPQDDTPKPQPRPVCPLESDTLQRDIAAILVPQPDGHPSEHGQQQDARGVGSSRLRAQQPRLTIEVPRRPETAPSQIHPPAITNTSHTRSSIAKPPIFYGPPSGQQQYPQQSIFPTYNPDLPLQQQNYAPAQMNKPQIPRAIISRQSYFDPPEDSQNHSNAHSHYHGGAAGQSHNPPVVPKTCTTDQLRELWKVANGWKASGSEGKVFCLKLSQQRDAPIYNLSSASQAFYNLRLDPTSASANICLSRYDPAKSLKTSRTSSRTTSAGILGVGSRGSESKHWHEALCTTIEEESRRHRPNDGLVAILKPSSATRMVIERPEDPLYAAAADRECARLVWDDDSASYFLVHPALASPFRVAITRSPAWSRFEYTLEHHESPHHLAKLTRDGTGGGWLEIDTGIASKIEAFYVVDVAVAALLLIAAIDDRRSPAATKTFDAPPLPEMPRKSHSRSILLSRHQSPGEDEGQKQKRGKEKGVSRIQQFEVDVESQDGSLGKNNNKKSRDKGPFLMRVITKLASGLLNCFVWVLTITFRCLRGICMVFCKCLVSKY